MIATFLLANEGSNKPFPQIGIPEGHHDLTHNEAGDQPTVHAATVFTMKQLGTLLTALKGGPETMHLPVILLSAKAQVADVQRGLDLGADDYVTKPFDPLELIARVYDVLAKSRS